MTQFRLLPRAVILAVSMVSACAVTDPSAATVDAKPHRNGAFISGTAAGAYLAGTFAEQQGDLDYAADSLLRALSLNQTSPDIHSQALIATLLAGRPEAIKLAREEPNNQAAQLLLAGQDVKSGNWEQAQRRYDNLPNEGVTQLLRPLMIAWVQMGAGHADTALATLKPYTEGQRFRAVYAFHAAAIADLAGHTAEAARLYQVAQTEFGTANLDLARAMASFEARNGQATEAQKTLAALGGGGSELGMVVPRLQADVGTRPIRRPADGIAEGYLAMAAALHQQQADSFAAILLRLALDLRPDLTTARLLSSEVFAGGQRLQPALAVLEAVTPSDPLAPLVDMRRAALLQRQGNVDEALKLLAAIGAAYPDRPEPWAMQGAILRGQHRYAEAVTAYDKAVALVPNPTKANWPLFYERGIAEERSKQWPKAEADFQFALKLSPDEPFVLNYLGYSWTEQGQKLQQAQEMIEKAARGRPNDGAIVDSLGWIALRRGDVNGAVANLERATELEPEDPTINSHLGDAYWAAGRKLEALYQWRLALALKPEPEDIAHIESRLREAEAATHVPAEAPTQSQAQSQVTSGPTQQ
jgi:tetratricopeptide (TPR) repeat protein